MSLKCECGNCGTCLARERGRRLRAENPEPLRKNDRDRYYRDKEKRLAAMRVYQAANPERIEGHKAAWRARNPEKRRAQNIASGALRRGKIQRAPCEHEGSECRGRLEMHHDDYSKPLEVRWLCSAHHSALRRKETP